MTPTQKTTIKGYARVMNTAIAADPNPLLDFVVEDVASRVMIYLNAKIINPELNRIIARVVVGVYNKTNAEKTTTGGAEREIKSLSDNGQSLTYGEEVKHYLATTADDDLFSGFTTILNRYREADCGNSGVLYNSTSE